MLLLLVQDWTRYLSDGLHFSPSGAECFGQLLWPAVRKRTSHLAAILPNFADVDPDNPAAALLV